jgi:hypothetical protein
MKTLFIFNQKYYTGKMTELAKIKIAIEDFVKDNGIEIKTVPAFRQLHRAKPFDNLSLYDVEEQVLYCENIDNMNLLMLMYGHYIHILPDSLHGKKAIRDYVQAFREKEYGAFNG